MRKRRVDKNQSKIIRQLRDEGFSVYPTHFVGQGFPDLVVGLEGWVMLVELKSKGGVLTDKEREFIEGFKGTVAVCYNKEEVIDKFMEMVSTLQVKRGDNG